MKKINREVDPMPLAPWVHSNMEKKPKGSEQNFNIAPFTQNERNDAYFILRERGYQLIPEGNNLLVRK